MVMDACSPPAAATAAGRDREGPEAAGGTGAGQGAAGGGVAVPGPGARHCGGGRTGQKGGAGGCLLRHRLMHIAATAESSQRHLVVHKGLGSLPTKCAGPGMPLQHVGGLPEWLTRSSDPSPFPRLHVAAVCSSTWSKQRRARSSGCGRGGRSPSTSSCGTCTSQTMWTPTAPTPTRSPSRSPCQSCGVWQTTCRTTRCAGCWVTVAP